MSKLSDELELVLERVVEKRVEQGIYGYHRCTSTVREYVTQEFAEWLVEKFEEAKNV